MGTTTLPTTQAAPENHTSEPANGHASAWVPASRAASVPGEVIDRLSVYLAGRDEAESVQELAKLAGAARPDGALMLAAVDGKLLAAGSISDGQVVNVPSPSGTAAAAVLRYRLAGLRRRRS